MKLFFIMRMNDLACFYANASETEGFGHVIRQLSLVEELLDRGVEVVFYYKAMPALLIEAFKSNSVSVRKVNSVADIPSFEGVLFIDDYSLSLREWEVLNSNHAYICFYNDNIGLPHSSIFLSVNPSNSSSGECFSQYTLRGPEYRLIRSEFKRFKSRSQLNYSSKDVAIVSLMLGANDALQNYQTVVEALCEFEEISAIKVLTTLTEKEFYNKVKLPKGEDRINIITSSKNLPMEMAESDLAVCAAGGGMYEYLFLGVPTIALIVTDNQLPAIQDEQLKMVCEVIDYREENSHLKLSECMLRLVSSRKLRSEYSHKSKLHIDGHAAERICDFLHLKMKKHNNYIYGNYYFE